MPVTKATASAAVSALKNLDTSSLFESFKNSHLYAQHTTKQNAKTAAMSEGQTKGYFEKRVNLQVGSVAEFKNLSEKRQKRLSAQKSWKKPPAPSAFGKDRDGNPKDVSLVVTEPISQLEYIDLLRTALKDANADYYESHNEPESRFVFVADLPGHFVGGQFDRFGNKAAKASSGTLDAVAIIIAVQTPNHKIVTAFPVDSAAYAAGLNALV